MAAKQPLMPRSTLFHTEAERITMLEHLLHMDIDEVDGVDTAVIAIGSSLFGVTLIFLVIAWINHSFRPIRAKNLPMTTIMFVAGILWFLGDIPMNGHVLIKGTWSHCKEWNIWVRVLFCFIYTTVIISRCYALDRVFNQNKPTRGLAYYAPTIVLLIFVIGYSVVTEAMSSKLTIGYDSEVELCTTTEGYVGVTLGVLWVNWLIIIIMMIRLRNIQSTFNEFVEFLFICAFGIAAMIKTTVVHFAHPKYPLIRGYRVAETLGDVVISNGIILIIIAYPVIMSVVRPKAYEREWLLRLRTDGLQDMYEANLNLRADAPVHYARMDGSIANQMEKAILEEENSENAYFAMQGYGNARDGGYMTAEELQSPPHSGRDDTVVDSNKDLHKFDRDSINSMDTVDEKSKTRRIL